MITINLPINPIKGRFAPHSITLYDDIDNMPVGIFSKFNKFSLLSGSVGSSLADFDKNHFAPLYKLVGEKEKLTAQLDNLRQLFNLISKEINVKSYAFCCMVHSVDGKNLEYPEDYSENSMDALIVKFTKWGLTNEIVKKKLSTSPLRYSSS